MRSLSGAVSRLSEAACPGVRGHCSAAWFHLSLFVRSCYNEPWSSIMQPSSRWWVVYVRGQQILSWVSNCTKTTVAALIIKTSHHYYKRYLWTCKHKTAQCLGEVFQCKRPTVHSSGANVSRRCIAVLSRITWRVIKIWTASLSAVRPVVAIQQFTDAALTWSRWKEIRHRHYLSSYRGQPTKVDRSGPDWIGVVQISSSSDNINGYRQQRFLSRKYTTKLFSDKSGLAESILVLLKKPDIFSKNKEIRCCKLSQKVQGRKSSVLSHVTGQETTLL